VYKSDLFRQRRADRQSRRILNRQTDRQTAIQSGRQTPYTMERKTNYKILHTSKIQHNINRRNIFQAVERRDSFYNGRLLLS